MRSDLWPRIDQVVEQALDLPPSQRMVFVEEACGEEEELKSAVCHLLAADLEIGSFLQHPPLEDEDAAGERLDRYRILRLLGHGGMGSVYLAERADGQFNRQVAVKVVRKDIHHQEVRFRFYAERQVLAGLEHPNIARLYDSGTAEDGRPYLVMEYVEGLPIDTYCDTHRLPIEERLRLFARVCAAVHYAHRNLVVHRDLKPGNILVTADGTPKLLDFGIAKLLDLEGFGVGPELTGSGMSPMTPGYASPEQVRGAAISTATDVYSLGVVLYRLLTGRGPYSPEDALPHELAQQICEQDPVRPSDRQGRTSGPQGLAPANEPGSSLQTISRQRSTHPRELKRHLRGDLDRIVLMAMRKEPERRYSSAQEFGADLERHLADRPVLAQPASVRYRFGKFVRRNAALVMTSSLVVALLISFSLTSSLQAARIDREREYAEQEREKAQQVSDFLLDLFDDADPDQAQGKDVTVREVLDQGAKKIENFRDQPQLQAAYMTTIGQVYRRLGHFEAAAHQLEAALNLRRSLGGENPLELAQSLHEKAVLHYLQSEYGEAEPLFVEAVALHREHLGDKHPELADVLVDFGLLVFNRGRPEEAEGLFREALAIQRNVYGEAHEETANTLHCLAFVLEDRGDHQAAEPLFREAVAMYRKLHGGESTGLAFTLYDFAYLLLNKGDYDAAEPLYRESLAMYRKLLGEEHATVGNCLNDLGMCLQRKGEYAAAEPLYRESVAIQRKALGDDHSFVGTVVGNLARMLIEWGDIETAQPLCQEALATYRKSLGDENPLVAHALTCLANAYLQNGDLASAAPPLEEALQLQGNALGDEHPSTLRTLGLKARLLLARGEFEAAAALHRRVLIGLRESLGDEHPRVASGLHDLGTALFKLGDLVGGEAHLRQALAMNQHFFGSEHPRVAKSQVVVSQILLKKGQVAEAETLARQAHLILEQKLFPGSWPIAEAKSVLGACLSALKRNSEAEELLLESYSLLREHLGEEGVLTRDARRRIIMHYEKLGQTLPGTNPIGSESLQ